jgi:hypothetical protein
MGVSLVFEAAVREPQRQSGSGAQHNSGGSGGSRAAPPVAKGHSFEKIPVLALDAGRRPGDIIRRAWDDAAAQCGTQQADHWIKTVTVDQETPQKATIEWNDGSLESDSTSTGKGHCCVDAANASGTACTVGRSNTEGSNCTAIGTFSVKNRVADHSGVALWTEFIPDRGIALHKYAPVDGTPLSHGCVRLNEDMARKIFCGARRFQTQVIVQGFARPQCDHDALQSEWLSDFKTAGSDPKAPDGLTTPGEIAEARQEMNAAFGRTLKPEEYATLTAADIPRCKSTAAPPKPKAP